MPMKYVKNYCKLLTLLEVEHELLSKETEIPMLQTCFLKAVLTNKSTKSAKVMHLVSLIEQDLIYHATMVGKNVKAYNLSFLHQKKDWLPKIYQLDTKSLAT